MEIGKYTKKWLKTRKLWVKLNPPNHEGYYVCYICGAWVLPNEMWLDHIKSRSRFPELRFVLSNLAPACIPCNMEKGSGDLVNPTDEFSTDSAILTDIW